MTAPVARRVKQVDCYRCPMCDKPWEEESDAYACCHYGSDDVAWACGGDECDNGLHDTEQEAVDCARNVPDAACACSHLKTHHAVGSGTWKGCYDLDCRCPGYEGVPMTEQPFDGFELPARVTAVKGRLV